MKKQIISISIIFAVLLMAGLVSADCKIEFNSQINSYPGTSFEAGFLTGATDSYDPVFDVMQPGMPGGKYTQMRSLVDSMPLAKDFRSNSDNKKWEITKIAVDPDSQGLSGTDSLTWTIDCSDSIKLTLIDYGNDKTRTNIVKSIDLKQTNSYSTEVSNVIGPYRYLNLILSKTITCTENWQCTAWSKCTKQIQTRTCTDLNKCGTTNNKPAVTQSCKPGKPKTTSEISAITTSTDSSGVIHLGQPAETQQTQKSLLSKIKDFFSGLF